MSLEALADTAEIIERLNKLEQYLPNQASIIYKFGKSFAYHLGASNRISVNAFYINFVEAISSIKNDQDPIKSLVEAGYLMDKLIGIAKAICPDEFAKGVEEFHELNED